MYRGGLVQAHGQVDGFPAGNIVLDAQEQLVGMFGKAGPSISQLGFKSSYGISYGPWGGAMGGSSFASGGPVVAFFGAMRADSCCPQDCLGALGVWISNVPAPPQLPAPPPPPPPARGMFQSQLFGGNQDFAYSDWDDGPLYPGRISHLEWRRQS